MRFMRGSESDNRELLSIITPTNGDVKIDNTYFWRFSINPKHGQRQAEKFRYDRTGRSTSDAIAWAWLN